MIYWGLMALMTIVCVTTAMVRRGRVRKVAIAVGLSWIVSALIPVDLSRPLWAILIVDALLLAALMYWALKGFRAWLVVAAAGQMLVVFTHIAFATDARLEQWGYLTAYYVWSLIVLASVVAGALDRRPDAAAIRPAA